MAPILRAERRTLEEVLPSHLILLWLARLFDTRERIGILPVERGPPHKFLFVYIFPAERYSSVDELSVTPSESFPDNADLSASSE